MKDRSELETFWNKTPEIEEFLRNPRIWRKSGNPDNFISSIMEALRDTSTSARGPERRDLKISRIHSPSLIKPATPRAPSSSGKSDTDGSLTPKSPDTPRT